MLEQTPQTRTFELSLDLPASIERVWSALADGEELTRWFPLQARVTGGVGGGVWLSWGPWCDLESPIEIWEPPTRLRYVWRGERTDETGATRVVPLATDFHLSARGGTTVLRLVHSGFGRGAEWDDEFDSISNGWAFELRSLRHYLSRHAGSDRGVAYARAMTDRPRGEAFDAMLAALAVTRGGDPGGGGAVLPGGVRTALTTLVDTPGKSFCAVAHALDDALLRVEVEPGGRRMPFLWLSLWGERRHDAPAMQERLHAVMASLFGADEVQAR